MYIPSKGPYQSHSLYELHGLVIRHLEVLTVRLKVAICRQLDNMSELRASGDEELSIRAIWDGYSLDGVPVINALDTALVLVGLCMTQG